MASSPIASGTASPRSPLGSSIGAVELTQRLAAKGLLPQQLSHHPHIQQLQHQQQVVISPAETLVISTSALDGENYIVSSANRWTCYEFTILNWYCSTSILTNNTTNGLKLRPILTYAFLLSQSNIDRRNNGRQFRYSSNKNPRYIILQTESLQFSDVMLLSKILFETWILGTTVYEGECGFRISFAPQMKETKSAQWTYSSMLHKLFTRINAACPIRFQCAYKLPPSGTVLRALPIYMQVRLSPVARIASTAQMVVVAL